MVSFARIEPGKGSAERDCPGGVSYGKQAGLRRWYQRKSYATAMELMRGGARLGDSRQSPVGMKRTSKGRSPSVGVGTGAGAMTGANPTSNG